jgi:predicted transcriptional regulator
VRYASLGEHRQLGGDECGISLRDPVEYTTFSLQPAVFYLPEEKESIPRMTKRTRGEFETVVGVLGNPIRRQIIRKLSEGPDYTLRLSNELNIDQQLATKHLKIIKDAELVDVVREKGDKGADKKLFSLNKFYSIQIDFSPSLYNERLISFNKPEPWGHQDSKMEHLESKINEIKEEEGVERLNPLSEIVSVIDVELEQLEKRRARLLFIRNLAMNVSHQAIDELDRRKKQIVRTIIDQGATTIESLGRILGLGEYATINVIEYLEREELVKRVGNIVQLNDEY